MAFRFFLAGCEKGEEYAMVKYLSFVAVLDQEILNLSKSQKVVLKSSFELNMTRFRP